MELFKKILLIFILLNTNMSAQINKKDILGKWKTTFYYQSKPNQIINFQAVKKNTPEKSFTTNYLSYQFLRGGIVTQQLDAPYQQHKHNFLWHLKKDTLIVSFREKGLKHTIEMFQVQMVDSMHLKLKVIHPKYYPDKDNPYLIVGTWNSYKDKSRLKFTKNSSNSNQFLKQFTFNDDHSAKYSNTTSDSTNTQLLEWEVWDNILKLDSIKGSQKTTISLWFRVIKLENKTLIIEPMKPLY